MHGFHRLRCFHTGNATGVLGNAECKPWVRGIGRRRIEALGIVAHGLRPADLLQVLVESLHVFVNTHAAERREVHDFRAKRVERPPFQP